MKNFCCKIITTALVPVLIYSILSICFFGTKIWPHLTTQFIGTTTGDGYGHIWLIGMWQYNFAHLSKSLLITPLVWAPFGLNMVHTGGYVGIGLLNYLLHLTTQSPIFLYNFWIMITLVISALSAFFLCLYISKNYFSSIVGGYLFGFSPYFLGHINGGHLTLLFIFFMPLLLLLYLAYLNRSISQIIYIICTTLLMTFAFLFSPELLIIYFIIGFFVWLFVLVTDKAQKEKLIRSLPAFFIASIIALLLVSPIFYFFFHHYTTQFSKNIIDNSGSVVGFFVPSSLFLLGGHFFESISNRFPADLFESNYIGIPLLLIISFCIAARRQFRAYRILLFGLLVGAIFVLGPELHIFDSKLRLFSIKDHIIYMPMPWALFSKLPVLDFIIPNRFMCMVYLILAMLTCIWMCNIKNKAIYFVMTPLILLFWWPAYVLQYQGASSYQWITKIHPPHFLKDGQYQRYISKNDSVFFIPFSEKTGALQAMTGGYYRLTAYTTDSMPTEISMTLFHPLLVELSSGGNPHKITVPNFDELLARFILLMKPNEIVVSPQWNTKRIGNILTQLHYFPVYKNEYTIYQRTFGNPHENTVG